MDEMKALISAQQGELDAAVMYKALAEKMKNEKYKAMLLQIGADEGRHASILKKITCNELKPDYTLARLVCVLVKILGRRPLFFIMAKIETASFDMYKPYFEKYPKLREIAEDEVRHGKLLLGK